MTPIVCGQGRRSSSERNPPTAAAQAERSLFREAKGSGRRGWLTKPPPCGRCGLSPSFGEVGKLRRAARRNQGSSDLTELPNRRPGWSFGFEGEPNGTRRLTPEGTAEPKPEPRAPARTGRDPIGACSVGTTAGKRQECKSSGGNRNGTRLELRLQREPERDEAMPSGFAARPGGWTGTPGRCCSVSNPPRRQALPFGARRHRLDAVGAGGNASPHRVWGQRF